MCKHTLGPWELDEHDNIIKGADGSIVCADGTGAFIAIPNDADARLMTAAPELLEALKRLIESSRDCGEMQWYSETALASPWDMARAVIERAIGAKP